MEKAKQVGRSSSSFTTDLFGPKESSASAPLSGSIFDPVPARDTSSSTPSFAYGNAKHSTKDLVTSKKDMTCNYENGSRVEPCYYNSSIYYGGREDIPPANHNANPPLHVKKDGGDADPNETNSNCASRGNWWKGSLYY